jgi:hypothetical protein
MPPNRRPPGADLGHDLIGHDLIGHDLIGHDLIGYGLIRRSGLSRDQSFRGQPGNRPGGAQRMDGTAAAGRPEATGGADAEDET